MAITFCKLRVLLSYILSYILIEVNLIDLRPQHHNSKLYCHSKLRFYRPYVIGRQAKVYRWCHLPPGGTGVTPPYLKMFNLVICTTIPSFTVLIQSTQFDHNTSQICLTTTHISVQVVRRSKRGAKEHFCGSFSKKYLMGAPALLSLYEFSRKYHNF